MRRLISYFEDYFLEIVMLLVVLLGMVIVLITEALAIQENIIREEPVPQTVYVVVQTQETQVVTETTTQQLETTFEETTVTTTTETTVETVVETEPEVNEEELELLAHLINAEAGCDWCTDTMMYYTGSVVLNRVDSDRFPDTLESVIYQNGQYQCTWDGNFEKTPTERAYLIARDLLISGSIIPSNVVYQAQFSQGSGIYAIEQNMYFCYE